MENNGMAELRAIVTRIERLVEANARWIAMTERWIAMTERWDEDGRSRDP